MHVNHVFEQHVTLLENLRFYQVSLALHGCQLGLIMSVYQDSGHPFGPIEQPPLDTGAGSGID
jgi:hypothetical protein